MFPFFYTVTYKRKVYLLETTKQNKKCMYAITYQCKKAVAVQTNSPETKYTNCTNH